MKFNIMRIDMSGIKNLQDLISIEFSPQTVSKKISKSVSNVKAIYGTNGTGKSAIMNGVYLYKSIMLEPYFLKQSTEITKLNKLINKETKEFYISIVFSLMFKFLTLPIVYKSELKIKIDDYNNPYIEFEKLSILKDQTINGEYSTIYVVNNGDLIISGSLDNFINNFLIKLSANTLKYKPLVSVFEEPDTSKEIYNYTESLDSKKDYGILSDLAIQSLFSRNISIYLDEIDLHNEIEFDSDDFNSYKELLNKLSKGSIISKSLTTKINTRRDIVLKKNFSLYEKNINKLYKFIKLFKPDLHEIRIEKTEDKDHFYCYKKMVYKDYEIDSDYESAGIQKLMTIFSYLEDVTNDKMVFIDELDANINGVNLKVLIEYFNSIKKGQLCFTTHNLYPMEYLYSYSHSIYFLGETGKLVSWKKNGHYRPYNQYPEGMIPDAPFNIDALDFIKIFENGDSN